MIANWQTTLAGAGPFIIGFAHIIASVANKQMPEATDVGLVLAGVTGFFAKDASTTGIGVDAHK